jgi:RNA polymerase sigma factor, sigma-70 family
MLENQQDAEDILQDVYTKLWEKRGELAEILNYESFSVSILKNSCLDFLKKNKRYNITDEVLDIPDLSSSSIDIENTDQLRFIHRLEEYLPDAQRQVFRLHYRDDFSIEEITEITGLNKGNVKVILSRARKLIKEYIERYETRRIG